jgi:hypothetical protein
MMKTPATSRSIKKKLIIELIGIHFLIFINSFGNVHATTNTHITDSLYCNSFGLFDGAFAINGAG